MRAVEYPGTANPYMTGPTPAVAAPAPMVAPVVMQTPLPTLPTSPIALPQSIEAIANFQSGTVGDYFNKALEETAAANEKMAKQPKRSLPWITMAMDGWALALFGGLVLKGTSVRGETIGHVIGGLLGLTTGFITGKLDSLHTVKTGEKPEGFSFFQLVGVALASSITALRRVIAFSQIEAAKNSDSKALKVDKKANLTFNIDAWGAFLKRCGVKTEHLSPFSIFKHEFWKALKDSAFVLKELMFWDEKTPIGQKINQFFVENAHKNNKFTGVYGAYNSAKGFAQGVFKSVGLGKAPEFLKKPLAFLVEVSHGLPVTRYFAGDKLVPTVKNYRQFILPALADTGLYAGLLLGIGYVYRKITEGSESTPKVTIQPTLSLQPEQQRVA